MSTTLRLQDKAERLVQRTRLCVAPLAGTDPRSIQWGIEDESSERPELGACLWNADTGVRNFLQVPRSGARTVVEVLRLTCKKHGGRRAVGQRDLIKIHDVEEGGIMRKKMELTNTFSWMSYHEYGQRVSSLATGLANVGLRPRDKVVLLAETQRDWMTCALAAWSCDAQLVTLYATLGEAGILHGLLETNATMVITDDKQAAILMKLLSRSKVKVVVTMQIADDAIVQKIKVARCGCYAVSELVETGSQGLKPVGTCEPRGANNPKDTALVMYTSGTTGQPKGVVLSHANIIAALAGFEHNMQGRVTEEDVYLAYLPLAHIMELVAELYVINHGAAIGYGSPHTLVQGGVKLKTPESQGDAPLLQPTIMVFAPAVLDKLRAGVQAQREKLSEHLKKLWDCGISSGRRRFERGIIGANVLCNEVVFKKVQANVGGRLKYILSGSAPVSKELQSFCQTVLGVPIRQGYGLTETTGGATCAAALDNAHGSVGPPAAHAVLRLADWQEGGYLNIDRHNPAIGMRRGEVLIGGPTVCQGYYVNAHEPDPELERRNREDFEVIDGIRYFRTGDIGQIRKNGTLEIIDRKKDLWKGPNGEYVSLTKVEAAIKLCKFVEGTMSYGRVGENFHVSIVSPAKGPIMALAKELGEGGEDLESVCANKKVLETVAATCKASCRESRLQDFEIPKEVALVPDQWTPENDCLTAAMKLRRAALTAKYKNVLDSLYERHTA